MQVHDLLHAACGRRLHLQPRHMVHDTAPPVINGDISRASCLSAPFSFFVRQFSLLSSAVPRYSTTLSCLILCSVVFYPGSSRKTKQRTSTRLRYRRQLLMLLTPPLLRLQSSLKAILSLSRLFKSLPMIKMATSRRLNELARATIAAFSLLSM